MDLDRDVGPSVVLVAAVLTVTPLLKLGAVAVRLSILRTFLS